MLQYFTTSRPTWLGDSTELLCYYFRSSAGDLVNLGIVLFQDCSKNRNIRAHIYHQDTHLMSNAVSLMMNKAVSIEGTTSYLTLPIILFQVLIIRCIKFNHNYWQHLCRFVKRWHPVHCIYVKIAEIPSHYTCIQNHLVTNHILPALTNDIN